MIEIHCEQLEHALDRANRFSPPDGRLTGDSVAHLLNHYNICEDCLQTIRANQLEVWRSILAHTRELETVMHSVWLSAFMQGFETAMLREESEFPFPKDAS